MRFYRLFIMQIMHTRTEHPQIYIQDDRISPLKNLCNSLFVLWLPFFNIWIQKRMHPDVCQVSFLEMYNFYNFKMNISLCTLIPSGFLFFYSICVPQKLHYSFCNINLFSGGFYVGDSVTEYCNRNRMNNKQMF